MLQLDGVSKVFRTGTFGGGTVVGVDNVTVDIGEGEIVSLIGESGSGKTTIGRMILRLTPITSGSISYAGTDISTLSGPELKEYYRQVQGVFQDPFSSYNPVFKADRILDILRREFFPAVDHREWNGRVHDALRSVGLDPNQVLGRYPHQLSGGQLQRVLIARALLLNVRFLVADEVISMLDASTRIEVLNLLADLKAGGLSILFITHDLSLGYYISERTMILYRGRVVEMGDTEKVFDNPLHPYTRMLMAAVPHLDSKWADEGVDLVDRMDPEHGGCVYYDRCPLGSPALGCDRSAPHLVEAEPGHLVACFAV